jgi:hypothetical protein
MDTIIEQNILHITSTAARLIEAHPERFGAVDGDVTMGRLEEFDEATGNLTKVIIDSDDSVRSVNVGFTVTEHGPKTGRPVYRALRLIDGVLSLEYGAHEVIDGSPDAVEVYRIGEGFLPGIGLKRQKAAQAYTVLMLRQLEDQLEN